MQVNPIHNDFEQTFKTMFELTPDGFLIADINGNVQFASQSGMKMFGIDDSDIERGINMFDHVHEEDKDRAIKNTAARLNEDYKEFSEYRVVRKDGTVFWNETNAAFLKDDQGNPTTLLVIFRDITNRKNQEAILQENTRNLQELNKIKDKFFSIIAHDLKNPFNGIIGFSELLLTELKNNNIKKSLEYASIIHQASINGRKLLINLLEWSRLQTGKVLVNNQIFLLDEILDEEIRLIIPSALEKGIEILTNYDRNINIFSDKDILSTIFRNLLNNAVKYTSFNGRIKVVSTYSGGLLSVSFEDNGIGIGEQELKNIFSLESIYSTPGTNNERGTGLGLILCKDLIKMLEGEIAVESILGQGSKFIVSLPVIKAETIHYNPLNKT